MTENQTIPDLPPNVELVGDEEVPCCVVDIMTAEKLIPLLTALVEEKDEEIKNLRLELEKLKNFKKTKSDSVYEALFKLKFLKYEKVKNAVQEVATERRHETPITLMCRKNIPVTKIHDSEFGDFYCPTCFEQVKENEEKCPNCNQRLEVRNKRK